MRLVPAVGGAVDREPKVPAGERRDGRLGTRRIVSWVVAWDPLVKYVAVLSNADGVVVDLYWDLPSEVAWVPTDRCVPG